MRMLRDDCSEAKLDHLGIARWVSKHDWVIQNKISELYRLNQYNRRSLHALDARH
jgi:hypothetical protein